MGRGIAIRARRTIVVRDRVMGRSTTGRRYPGSIARFGDWPWETEKGESIVVDPKIIDDLARRVAGSMPSGLKALQSDLEQNFKAALQAGLGRLDLVTREEFEVQSGVLRRTREKLRILEERIGALEGGTDEDVSDSEDTGS